MQFVDYTGGATDGRIGECTIPEPNVGEVQCKVSAFGINRADLLQKQGKYPPPKGASEILGMEISGVVTAVGIGVSESLIGKNVCAMLTGGGYAQYVCFPAVHIIPVPNNLDLIAAAAIPEVFLTAYQALFSIANLEAGQNLLIHAGASGVGTAAITLAKLKGANVAITASTKNKLDFCERLGADITVNYRQEDFAEALTDANFFPDVILDFVGEGHLQKNVKVIAMDGTIVLLAMLGGRFVSQLDMARMLSKRVTLQASTLRNRSDKYKTALIEAFNRDFGDALQSGQLKPIIDTVFPVEQINIAHQRMEHNENIGKYIITW